VKLLRIGAKLAKNGAFLSIGFSYLVAMAPPSSSSSPTVPAEGPDPKTGTPRRGLRWPTDAQRAPKVQNRIEPGGNDAECRQRVAWS
jgi:hypothetical protein